MKYRISISEQLKEKFILKYSKRKIIGEEKFMEFRDLHRQYAKLQEKIDNEIAKVIAGSQFISGEAVEKLEKQLASYTGVKHCISCGNGTDAISIALMAYGIGPDHAVFVPDFTFFSSGECPAALGATPVFVDIKQDTYNMNAVSLESAVKKVIEDGKLIPKAVIAVDLFGMPADYHALRKVCDKYKMLLLEDGAQGFGGQIGKRRACSFGDISTTSFFPAKPLGCYGDGGAIFTDDDNIAQLCRSIAVHGKNADDKYDNIRIGMNSRLDTLQAAVLIPKFEAFQEYELRDVNAAAQIYHECLENIHDLILPTVPDTFFSSWAQYTVQLPISADRLKVQRVLKDAGIPSSIYYAKPMHQQGAFAGTYSANTDCPVTDELCKRVLSLPIHPYLEKWEINKAADVLRCALNKWE